MVTSTALVLSQQQVSFPAASDRTNLVSTSKALDRLNYRYRHREILVNKSLLAPFEHSGRTVLDKSVRSTWEIDLNAQHVSFADEETW